MIASAAVRHAAALLALAIVSVTPIAEAQIFQPGTQPIGEEGGIVVPIQGSITLQQRRSEGGGSHAKSGIVA